LQRIDHGPAFFLAHGAALLGRATADFAFDSVQLADPLKRLRGNRRRAGGCQLVEGAPHMRPAKGEPDVSTFSQQFVSGVAIDLEHALEVGEVRGHALCLAIGSIDISDTRRIGAAPWSVIAGVSP
jgi:hypothetical protein